MVRKLSFVGFVLAVLVLLVSGGSAAQGQWTPPKVAVIPFGVQNSRIPDQLAGEVHKSMRDALAKSRRFSVYDQGDLQKWLDDHLADVKGTLETGSAARIGQALGCDLVICGTVNTGALQDGEYTDSFGVHSARMGMVAVNFTVVNARAEELVTNETVKGIAVKEVSADSRRFDDELITQAARNSAEDFVAGFYYPSDGRVLSVAEDRFEVGLGSNHGITEKTVFEIYLPGLEIRDPANGELVGYEEGENLYARPLKDTIKGDTCHAELGDWKEVTKFLFESSQWRAAPEKLTMLQVGDRVRIMTPFSQSEEEQE